MVTDPVVVSVAIDWLHLSTGALWIGGLLQLLALRLGMRSDDSAEHDVMVCLLRRFGVAAAILPDLWATQFTQALRRGGAELVAAGYIPQDALEASLDATEN